MAEIAQRSSSRIATRPSRWSELIRKEDWWAIWIGLGLVAIAIVLFANGSSIKWLAVAPQKWPHLANAATQLQTHGTQYAALFLLWAVSLGIGAAALGIKLSRFLPAFLALYVAAGAIYFLGQWEQSAHYNLEPPLVALGLGLLISNTVGVPRWLEPGLRVEFYIKTGIVLLGAGLPLTLIAWAGPVAIVQAAIVSLATFGVIYFTGVRLGLDRRLAATLGTGGAVCGVSGAIAIGGAVGAKKEQVSIAISLVIVWAIVMIFVLPLAARALHLPTGVAGAWIGTSEFADAAGLAAAQTYGGYAGNVPGIAGNADAAVERLHAHEGHWPRHLDRGLGLRAVVDCDHELGAYRRAEQIRRRGNLAAVPEIHPWLSDRLGRGHSGIEGLRLCDLQERRAAGLGCPLAGASHLGIHICLSEHRPHHQVSRIRRPWARVRSTPSRRGWR